VKLLNGNRTSTPSKAVQVARQPPHALRRLIVGTENLIPGDLPAVL